MAHNKRFAKPGSTTAESDHPVGPDPEIPTVSNPIALSLTASTRSAIVQEITPASAGFFVCCFCGTRV